MSNEVTVSLSQTQDDLWRMFHLEVNEMIVTKSGRNFFPKLEYNVRGLDPQKFYSMMVQMKLVDNNRYKYSNGRWMHSGAADEHKESKKVWHSDGVRTGKEWMDTAICFERVKITNDVKATNACMISLHSMHKYVPVLTIFEAPSENPFVPTSSTNAIVHAQIPHTEFVAVTAYQNQKVIDLKIQFNSYAKGFRKEKQENRKRRAPSVADYSTDECNSKSSSPQPKWSRSSSSSPPDLSSSPFSTVSSPINPFLFSFPNFSPLTPPGGATPFATLPFTFPFFPFNSLSIPIPSAAVKEESKDSEEDVDVIH